MKKLTILLLLCIGVFTSCNEHHARYKTISKKTIKVKRDKVKNFTTNEEVYFYFIDGGSNSSSQSYYYTSTTPVSDFKGVDWTSGKPGNFNPQEIEEEEIEQVDLADLEASVQTEIEAENPSEISETDETVSDTDPGDASAGDSDGGGGGGDGGGGDGGGD